MIEIQCKSVVGGWQTCFKKSEYCFGPVFNCIADLWKWQRVNVFGKLE
jgi:hypothetical protein